MDKQATLNTVYKALKKQGEPGVDGKGEVCYQCGNKRCAIGHLLRDETLLKIQESNNNYQVLEDLTYLRIPELQINTPDDLEFLCQLQHAHDQSSHVKPWANKLRSMFKVVASMYKLKMPR